MAALRGDATYSHLRTTQIAGKELWFQKKCDDCHTLSNQADGKLTPVPQKRSDEWFKEHIQAESALVLAQSTSARKQRRILNAEIIALDDYLYKTPQLQKTEIDEMATNIFQGAYATYKNNCLRCHLVDGAGKDGGQDLTRVADKHGDRKWLMQNLLNPEQFSPETTMPRFDHLSKTELNQIVDYLMTLRK